MSGCIARVRARWQVMVMLAIAYVPMVTMRPGDVSADTKTYLFLDPSEVLREASSLWSSSVGAGTVTHQYIGYLWPMGPYFWLCEMLRMPDWLAQRLWWGSLVFLAMLGAWTLARRLGMAASGSIVAALLYGLSPYTLHYVARLSGILLPWVGLPWLIYCMVRRRDEPGPAWTARAALVIGTVGTVNATTLLFVVIGVGIWLMADASSRMTTWRAAAWSFLSLGLASVLVSIWWITSLVMQSRYGLPILRYSETYETVAKASLPQELLRGLGYWFFYGGDESGRWTGPSVAYMTRPVVIIAGFTLVTVALVAVTIARHAHRLHVSLMVLIGLGLATGAAPLDDSSPFGSMFARIVNNESGFALRSTPRALPLMILGFALATGFMMPTVTTAVTRLALARGLRPVPERFASGVIGVLLALVVVANNFPWFTHRVMTDAITRAENLPTYWTEAAAAIDAERDPDHGYGRTLEFPASNFADHWWGGTVDPILPGLLETEYLSKEMIPQGSEATTDLLSAFESRLVDGRADISLVGAVASLFAANTVTWRADLAYDHFLTARPEYLAPALAARPPGATVYTGPLIATSDRLAIVDESHYANPMTTSYPAAQVWRTPDPRPLLAVSPAGRTTTLVGSGEGLLDALSAGLLTPSDSIVYAGSRGHLPSALTGGRIPHLVVTDSNRKAARQWSSIAQQTGRTERTDETPVARASDQRLNPFTHDFHARVSVEDMSTSRIVGGVARVVASSYGHPVVMTPEARPENVIDRDNRTSWVVGVRGKALGEWIRIDYTTPVTTAEVKVDLSRREPGDRRLEQVRIDFLDSKGNVLSSRKVDVEGRDSITVPAHGSPFSGLKLTVTRESSSGLVDFSLAPGIAINDITIDGIRASEYIEVPAVTADLVTRADRTSIVLRRQHIDPSIPHRSDTERNLQRIVRLPEARQMQLSGSAQLAGRASEAVLSRLTGMTQASSNGHSPGSARSIAGRALDGDPTTSWVTPLDQAVGARIDLSLRPSGASRTMRFIWGDEGLSSTPTIVAIIDARGTEHTVDVVTTGSNGSAELPGDLVFPVRGVRIDEVRSTTFPNYFTKQSRQLPVSIAEIDLGTPNPLRTGRLDPSCRDDLVEVNARPIPVRVLQTSDIFDPTIALPIEACTSVDLVAGENVIRTAVGWDAGIDVNSLVLTSMTPSEPTPQATPDATVRAAEIITRSRDRIVARLDATSPQIISFAQSINDGWHATLRTDDGRTVDLGAPFVVQGYANGWLITEPGELTLQWRPQRVVNTALWFSGLTAVALMVLSRRRTHPSSAAEAPVPPRARVAPIAKIVLVLLAAVFGGIVPAAVATVVASAVPRLAAILATGLIGFVSAAVVLAQMRHGYPPTLDWPMRFADLAPWTWIAVAVSTINPMLRRD